MDHKLHARCRNKQDISICKLIENLDLYKFKAPCFLSEEPDTFSHVHNVRVYKQVDRHE